MNNYTTFLLSGERTANANNKAFKTFVEYIIQPIPLQKVIFFLRGYSCSRLIPFIPDKKRGRRSLMPSPSEAGKNSSLSGFLTLSYDITSHSRKSYGVDNFLFIAQLHKAMLISLFRFRFSHFFSEIQITSLIFLKATYLLCKTKRIMNLLFLIYFRVLGSFRSDFPCHERIKRTSSALCS